MRGHCTFTGVAKMKKTDNTRKWQPTSVFLSGKFHGTEKPARLPSPWGHKELDTTSVTKSPPPPPNVGKDTELSVLSYIAGVSVKWNNRY